MFGIEPVYVSAEREVYLTPPEIHGESIHFPVSCVALTAEVWEPSPDWISTIAEDTDMRSPQYGVRI